MFVGVELESGGDGILQFNQALACSVETETECRDWCRSDTEGGGVLDTGRSRVTPDGRAVTRSEETGQVDWQR